MTICVCVQVHDAMVFASDSATTLLHGHANGQNSVKNVYSHGNKVFNLLRGKPIAAMTAGLGNIGRQSISHLSKDLRRAFQDSSSDFFITAADFTVEECATKAQRFFFQEHYQNLPDELKPHGDHALDYWVGGYSTGADLPELWNFKIINGVSDLPKIVIPQGISSISWGGQPEAITRLVLGYGSSIIDALSAVGLPEDQHEPVLNHLQARLMTPLVEPAMPIQDAIDLADFLVEVSKGYARFLPGANTIGGETDIAAITKHEGFKWVRRKHYYPAHLNTSREEGRLD